MRQRTIAVLVYALGSFACLLLFEILSRIAGVSYIQSALSLSNTIVQGSFEESFVFIIKYLIQVELITGTILVFGLLVFYSIIVRLLIRNQFKNYSLILLLGISISTLYLFYAGAGYFLNKVVLYGRLIHQYLPFLCIFLAFTIQQLTKSVRIKNIIVLSVSLTCSCNFLIAFKNYSSYSYPRDIAWSLINKYPSARINSICEYENSLSVFPKHTSSNSQITKYSMKLQLINCCFFYPVDDKSKFQEFRPKYTMELLEHKIHFINFKGYQYEGYGKDERELIDKLRFEIKVFYDGYMLSRKQTT